MCEARLWYNLQQKGLGKRFIDDVKKTVSSIKLNPHFASAKFNNIRAAACNAFPFSIHYEIDEHESIVRIISYFILAEDHTGYNLWLILCAL